MRNFYTVEIPRKDLNVKDTFVFHLDGNFVHTETKSFDIRYEEEKPNNTAKPISIMELNEFVKNNNIYDSKSFENLFSFATGVYQEVDVSIVRNKSGKWSILHNDGTIFNNESLVEPVINSENYEIVGFSDSSLAPFYTKEGNIAFVNRNSETVATLSIDREEERAKLLDKNQAILKEWDFRQIDIPEELFFFGGNLCRLFEEEDFDSLLQEFLEEESSEFVFPSEIFGPSIGDEFNIDYEKVRKNDIHYGNIYILGYAYYTKSEWDKYNFLVKFVGELFKKEYNFFKNKLIKILGNTSMNYEDRSIWKVGENLLILDLFSDHSGGDFGYQIRLYTYDEN